MSYRTEHLVPCVRRDDLGCRATHPASRWDAMKADAEGWFHSKAEEQAYCPAHVPEWVPEWRARRAARLHKAEGTFAKLPAVLRCTGCSLELDEPSEDPDLLRALRDVAFTHVKETGHRVTVTTTQELTVEAVDE